MGGGWMAAVYDYLALCHQFHRIFAIPMRSIRPNGAHHPSFKSNDDMLCSCFCFVSFFSFLSHSHWLDFIGHTLCRSLLNYYYFDIVRFISERSNVHAQKYTSMHACASVMVANKTFINLIAVRPLSVDILLNNQPLSADRTYDIECQAIGSKPTAKITWWMNGVQLRSFREKVKCSIIKTNC